MSERYDRIACIAEPLQRGDIIKAIGGGWRAVKSFEVPKPIPTVEQDNTNKEKCDYREARNIWKQEIVDIDQLREGNRAGGAIVQCRYQ